MNQPYIPAGSLASALNRRWVRFAARAELDVALDHAIVSFTFDDFPKSAATVGAVALERRGWTGTYYASAAYAGGETHHGRMFDAGDLQHLTTRGHEIGCHTYGHLDAARVRTSDVMADVARNARALEAMGLDQALDSFAFPYGEASPAAKRALGEHFWTLRGVHAGINRARTDRNLLRAVPIDGGEAGIERAIEAAHSLIGHPGWLVYYTHDIQAQPTEWGCTPAQFERVCRAVEASGARVMTVRDAMATIGAEA
ncbi:polysaccharide deacetylase family protein [Maricaulis sp. CAU 1757]